MAGISTLPRLHPSLSWCHSLSLPLPDADTDASLTSLAHLTNTQAAPAHDPSAPRDSISVCSRHNSPPLTSPSPAPSHPPPRVLSRAKE
ncbi:hypothetical protein E2C01_098982 [Portunus trituberculatus]|uniref:Uncharacterized protein n=1 Tax=Portunus trituberculatus TaxID=210409 RepID=A0A5B7KE87_PORTR|nr:hypothetical protein [Portunus trituberculatus]